MKSVTAVIPTVGRDSLRAAVDSVVAQTASTDVIVVVDRPSELPSVQSMLSGVSCRIVATEGKRGGGFARNLGSQLADTEFVAYLDDDDWWVPEKIASQLSLCAQRDPSRDVLAAARMYFHRARSSSVIPTHSWTSSDVASYLVQRSSLEFGSHAIQTSSLLVSKSLWERIKWDETLKKHQDWDFVSRCARDDQTDFYWSSEPLSHVVQDSMSSVSKRPDWQASRIWLDIHRDFLTKQARGDFVASQILRSALQARSMAGLRLAVRELVGSRPHAAAVIVGLSGLRG
ncbi:glycosyltransferase [Rhodococcus fascians]|nr:glycosyltransferase [Rhodococcus fascians]